MADNLEQYKSDMLQNRFNPGAMFRVGVNHLRQVSSGKYDLVDPTNPVAYLLECSSVQTAAWMVENNALNRKQYPFSAQSLEDLYPHMSDKDYVDRFAVPSKALFVFAFDEKELLAKLVQEDDKSIRKITIPRNTRVIVADTVFSLQYPIHIREMAHGGLQIVYDVSLVSPLKNIETNVLQTSITNTDKNNSVVSIVVELDQFDIVSKSFPIMGSSLASIDISYPDKFCYCRVWVDNADGSFTEMQTTHTDTIYDPKSPTAVLQVLQGVVKVKIPQVYVNTQLISKSVRVDVYHTKGPLDMPLSNYGPENYEINWLALSKVEQDQFVAPLKSLRTAGVYSVDKTSGGQEEMDFASLRARVISNGIGAPKLPITPNQIESNLERSGYKLVKNIDNITNRVYLATRSMPKPSNDKLITAAAAGIATLTDSIEKIVQLSTVIDNGDLVTILPSTLYQMRDGVLHAASNSQVSALAGLPADKRAIAITSGDYYCTPFHYVLDTTENAFAVRPYFLDSPVIVARTFVAENDTTLQSVSTDAYAITKTDAGYKLTVVVKSGEGYKRILDEEVFIQLAFKPKGDIDYAYIKGTLVGKTAKKERVFSFDINSRFAIDKSNRIEFTNFQMYTTEEQQFHLSDLVESFEIIYSTNYQMPIDWRKSDVDAMIGQHQLPANTSALTHERVKLEFGRSLNTLWARARSVISEEFYERWSVDVPATYESDVYNLDPVTGSIFKMVNGELVYDRLHKAGDPVLDAAGDVVYKFRANDIKLDVSGMPLVVKARLLNRQFEIMLVEGAYYFATNEIAVGYRDELVQTVVKWLTRDLPEMTGRLLEKTGIYFYPTKSIGQVDAMFGSGMKTSVNAGQNFHVKLAVSQRVYGNTPLRTKIARTTVATIDECLKKRTVAVSDIIDALRTQYKEDVIGIEFKGLGGTANLQVLTLLDDAKRLSIRKRLTYRNDNTLALDEDVTVEFLRHVQDEASTF